MPEIYRPAEWIESLVLLRRYFFAGPRHKLVVRNPPKPNTDLEKNKTRNRLLFASCLYHQVRRGVAWSRFAMVRNISSMSQASSSVRRLRYNMNPAET